MKTYKTEDFYGEDNFEYITPPCKKNNQKEKASDKASVYTTEEAFIILDLLDSLSLNVKGVTQNVKRVLTDCDRKSRKAGEIHDELYKLHEFFITFGEPVIDEVATLKKSLVEEFAKHKSKG